MADKGRRNEISRQRAIAALLEFGEVRSAARAAHLGERTLHRWLREDPTFRAELRAAEAEAVEAAARRLAGLASDALSTIASIVTDTQLSAGVRLRGAIALLDQLTRLRELAVLEERVAALEAHESSQYR